MPKAPRTREEIDSFKEIILDKALELILEEGFGNLSMRKLASKLGLSATAIYNYFSGKDEINLNIRIRGFDMLYGMLTSARSGTDNSTDGLQAMVRAYVEFATAYPGYYDIMFNLHTPKYLDYVGTDLERTAAFEKETAMKNFRLFTEHVAPLIAKSGADPITLRNTTIRLWTDMHGIISIYNSRVLEEVVEGSRAVLDWRIDRLIDDFRKEHLT